jgi:hypothetical protein
MRPIANVNFSAVEVAPKLCATGDLTARAQDFEALLIAKTLEIALPKEHTTRESGQIWRSSFTEHVGRVISRSGGMGIAQLIISSQAKKVDGP